MVATSAGVLPSVVIGPRSAGRGYGVRHLSHPGALSQRAENMLADFAMALAAWSTESRIGATATCAFLLDAQTWFVARLAHVGQASMGEVAVAHGWILALPDHAGLARDAWSLIDHLPPPTSPDVVLSPRDVVPSRSPQAGPSTADFDALGAALNCYNLKVEVAGLSVTDAARAILDGYEGREPLSWITTAGLKANGNFDPSAAFDLILQDQDAGPARGFRPDLTIGPDGIRPGLPGPTPSRRVWLSAFSREGGPAWRRHDASVDAATYVRDTLARIAANDPVHGLEPSAAVARSASREDMADLADLMRAGIRDAFLDTASDHANVAELIDDFVDQVRPELAGFADDALARTALDRAALFRLGGRTQEVLSRSLNLAIGRTDAATLTNLLRLAATALRQRPVPIVVEDALTRLVGLLVTAAGHLKAGAKPALVDAVAEVARALAEVGDDAGLARLMQAEIGRAVALRPDAAGAAARRAVLDRVWPGRMAASLSSVEALGLINLAIDGAADWRRRSLR